MIDSLIRKIDFIADDRRLVSKLERLFLSAAKSGDNVFSAMEYLVSRDHYIAALVFLRIRGRIPENAEAVLKYIVNTFDLSRITEQSEFLAALALENDEAAQKFLVTQHGHLDDYITRLESSDNVQANLAYLINQSVRSPRHFRVSIFSSIARNFRITDRLYAEMCRDAVGRIFDMRQIILLKALKYIVNIFGDLPLDSYCPVGIYELHDMLVTWHQSLKSMDLFWSMVSHTELSSDEKLKLLKGFVPESPRDNLKDAAYYLYFAYSVILDPNMSEEEMRSFELPPLELDLESHKALVLQAFILPFISLMEAGSNRLRTFMKLASPVNPYQHESGYTHIRMFHIGLVSGYDADYYRRLFFDTYKRIIKDKAPDTLAYIYLNSPLRCWLNPLLFMRIFCAKPDRMINSPDFFEFTFTAKVVSILETNGGLKHMLVLLSDSDQRNSTFSVKFRDCCKAVTVQDVIAFRAKELDRHKKAILADSFEVVTDSRTSPEEAARVTYALCESFSEEISDLRVFKSGSILLELKHKPSKRLFRQLCDRVEYTTGYSVFNESNLFSTAFQPRKAIHPVSDNRIGSIIDKCYSNRNSENTPQSFRVNGNTLILEFCSFASARRAVMYNSGNLKMVADRTGYSVRAIPANSD